jgi:uncharacterized protein (TIGR03545 family)
MVPQRKEAALRHSVKFRWIRWKGLWIVLTVTTLFAGYCLFVMDLHLEWMLERFASALNGAQVNIGSFRTHLLSGECEIRGLEVTDKRAPLKNVLEIDQIAFRIQLAPLLAKKFVVDDLSIKGIKHGTDRRASGALAPTDEEDAARPGLLERVSTGLYADLRREIGDNPFRNIGILLTGMDLTSRVERSLGELSSNLKAHSLLQKLDEGRDRWDELSKNATQESSIEDYRRKLDLLAKSPKRGFGETSERLDKAREIQTLLVQEKQKTEALLAKLKDEISRLHSEEASIDNLINQDIRLLEGRLNLPQLDYADLSPMLLGPTLLNVLERIAYWVDLSRRRMPKGSHQGQLVTAVLERSRGTDIQFGTRATTPTFLLKHASISSDLSQDPFQGRVQGTVDGLTSNPSVYGKPTVLRITMDFPASYIEGLQGEMKIDHTGENASEIFTISANSFPLDHFSLSDAGDLILGFRKGHAKLSASVLFTENDINATLSANTAAVDYSVATHFKRLEEAVLGILDGLSAFNVNATLHGPLDKPTLQVKSELGERLAQGIHSEFRPQIGAIEDDLRKNILDRVHPEREQVRTTLQVVGEKVTRSLEARVGELKQLQLEADSAIARFGLDTQRSSRRAAK